MDINNKTKAGRNGPASLGGVKEKQALVERQPQCTTFDGEFQHIIDAANAAAACAVMAQDVGRALDLWNFVQALAKEGEE